MKIKKTLKKFERGNFKKFKLSKKIMFTSKQLSTIKQALEDKEKEERKDIEDLRRFDHNLILGTARLQEIYRQVCKESKSNPGKFNSNHKTQAKALVQGIYSNPS